MTSALNLGSCTWLRHVYILPLLLLNSCSDPTDSKDRSWQMQSSPSTADLRGVWGSSDQDVFAVGDNGTILHYNGSKWINLTSGTARDLYAVWGSTGSNLYAVGDSGTVLRFNGSTWSAVPGAFNFNYRSVWCGSDGTAYIGSSNGALAIYGDSEWRTVDSSGFYGLRSITGFFGYYHPYVRTLYSDVYGCSDSGVVHIDELSERRISMARPQDIWAASWYDFFAMNRRIAVLRTTEGESQAMHVSLNADLYAITGTNAENVFVVGDGICHYDGNKWSTMTKPASGTLLDVWADASGDVFAVGANGTILSYRK